MAKIGSGRGRGWLNLKEQPRPGINHNELNTSKTPKTIPENNHYEDLILQFGHLNLVDDGILLNEKIKHLRNVFMTMCKTEDETRLAVQELYEKCLKDDKFIEKVVILLTSAFFCNKQTSQEQLLWKDTVRTCFFELLQENFENREVLRKTNPGKFYNSLKLYSTYFRNLRKIHPQGCPLIESRATVEYLEMLLDQRELLDTRMFATMVCINCATLVQMYNEKTEKLFLLLDKLKLEITEENKLSKHQKLLLFFAWDLIRHKYDISAEDWSFYRINLEDDEINDILIKCNLGKPNKECTPEVRDEKNVAPSIEENKANHWSLHQPRADRPKIIDENNSTRSTIHKNKLVEKKFDSLSIHVESRPQPEQGEKLGRPILGVGARLRKF